MKFRNKILIAITGIVFGLLIVTYFVVTNWTEGRIRETFAEELRGNFSTVRMLTALQSDALIRAGLVLAESPRLRAVTELHDPRTAAQVSGEIARSSFFDVFVLTDERGATLVSLLHGRPYAMDPRALGAVVRGLASVATTDVWVLEDTAYKVVTAPLLVGTQVLGTLTIGFGVGDDDLATLERATNSEIVLIRGGAPLLSTLDSSRRTALAAVLRAPGSPAAPHYGDTTAAIVPVAIADDSYLLTIVRLNRPRSRNDRAVGYLLLKSVGEEYRRAIRPVLGMFGVLSAVFLVLTFVLGTVIARGITRPINELVRGTRAVGRGEYDVRLAIPGRGELHQLGERFTEMSRALKEKISELAQLNADLVGRNRDLDDALRRLREAQEEIVRSERLAATGKLTAQLAHEINNPIHNIQSSLDTALHRLPPGTRGRELVEVAHEEVVRMSKLARHMLDFHRTGIDREERRRVDLNTVVGDVVEASRSELERAGVHTHLRLDAGLPAVEGNPDKLHQVLLNLLLNARDAMPSGGTVEVDTGVEDGAVVLRVSDSGVGIPLEHLDRVFDAFFTTKSAVSGVGLGLSVSYGIVRQHGGSISVESSPGRGSRFTVRLPASGTATRDGGETT